MPSAQVVFGECREVLEEEIATRPKSRALRASGQFFLDITLDSRFEIISRFELQAVVVRKILNLLTKELLVRDI